MTPAAKHKFDAAVYERDVRKAYDNMVKEIVNKGFPIQEAKSAAYTFYKDDFRAIDSNEPISGPAYFTMLDKYKKPI